MSNRPRHRMHTPAFRYGSGVRPTKLTRYVQALLERGVEEREVARAVAYVQEHGFGALEGPPGTHTIFSTPSCGDRNCINPIHQTVVFEPE